MKLIKDFGVRALLATIAGVGFYILMGIIFWKYTFDTATLIAIIAVLQAPWFAAINFYLGMRAGAKSNEIPH